MFGLFRKKPAPARSTAAATLPSATNLTDSELIRLVLGTFEGRSPIVGALFLVAYENIPVYFPSFRRAMEEDKLFPPTLEGIGDLHALEHSKAHSNSEADEVAKRRHYYFYIAALLRIAHARADAKPALWDQIADIWVALLPGARALRSTLDKTELWRSEHISFFDMIKSEDEGEWHCLHILMPSKIRFHAKIVAWQERDLSPEDRAMLDETCRAFEQDAPGKPQSS